MSFTEPDRNKYNRQQLALQWCRSEPAQNFMRKLNQHRQQFVPTFGHLDSNTELRDKLALVGQEQACIYRKIAVLERELLDIEKGVDDLENYFFGGDKDAQSCVTFDAGVVNGNDQ